MAITVKHSKVSLIPDSGDDSLIEPSDWNADHELTGTIPVANGGTGADTLTGYVVGNGTSAMTASATIPNTDITGLGTASTKDAGSANGVATLDAGGKVPVSELPAAVLGALSYQGTWDASTNTPTLTSSTGTKGYYYVVAVAGSTDLDGITDWVVGDWAVFNGSIWQQVDNTDSVTSVNGQTGTVVLDATDVGAIPDLASATDNAVVRFDGTTGKLIQNSTVTVSDAGVVDGVTHMNDVDYIDFDTTYATTLGAGQLGWNGNDTLGLGMIGGNVIQHIGEDQFFYCKATATITKGQVIMFTGAVGASGVPTGAPATGITDGNYIMGVAAENIANNGFGLVQSFGTLRNVNTSGYADGDILWYNPAVTGGLTKTKPVAPNVKAQIAAVINGGSSGGGTILIRINAGSILGGSDSNAEIGSPSNGQIITYDGQDGYWKNTDLTAGTAISIGESATGVLTVTNTAPDQTVSLTAGTGISTSGTYPNFTVTNTAPDQTVALSSGTGISVSGTYPNFTVTNTAPSSGGTVTSVTGTAPVSVATGTTTPVISLASGYGDTQNPYASKTANYILAAPNGSAGVPTFRAMVAADVPTLNQNTTGTASNVTGTVAIANGGTGATTRQNAMDALAGAVTSGQYLRGNGTDVVMSAIQAADVPTLNQNTTGSAATLTTGRTIGMTGDVTWTSGSFNGSANVTGTATLATVTAAKGGTGQTSYAVGDLLYASTSSALSKLADVATGNALISGGVGVAPSYGKIGLTTHISGTLAIGNGGTGQTTATAAFNALNPMTTTGDILYEASPTTAARLAIGSTGQVLTVSGGLPAWATPVASNITTKGMYENASTISANYTIGAGNNAMSAGPITVNTGVTVTVPTGSTWTIV